MKLGSPNSFSSVGWMQGSLMAHKQQPLTWYKVGNMKELFDTIVLFSSLHCLMGLRVLSKYIQNL